MSGSRNSFTWHRRNLFGLVIFVLAAAVMAPVLSAQTGTGRVIGTITDESGAAIAGARVTVTNADTNVHWESTSGTDGSYQVLDLPIGNYTVAAEHEGFRKAVTPKQELQINQSLRIDVRLKVGSVAETVTVEALAAQVETVSPTVGGTVTGATIQNLPLNGRNTLDLALTLPGITPSAGSPAAGAGVPAGAFSVAGGRDDSVTYLLDGGNNTSVTYGAPVMNPNPDTVAEFRILINNYTSEYGRSAGGVVSVVTKSGTNQFHGSLFDYLRNDAFNANTFFNKANPSNPLPRPVLKRNQFGGTAGGPIKKDRLFFFFGYQGQRENSVTVGSQLQVFTQNELKGNFSQAGYLGGGTGIVGLNPQGVSPGVACFLSGMWHNAGQIVNNAVVPIPDGTPCGQTANTFFQPNAALAYNGIIQQSSIDPVAKAYIASGLIPSTTNADGIITPNGPAYDNRNEYTGKIDFNISQNDRLSITLTNARDSVGYPFLTTGGAPNAPGYPGKDYFNNYFGNIGYTRTVTPTMLNDFHFTAQRAGNTLNQTAKQLPGPSQLDVAVTPDLTSGPPQLLFTNSGMQLGFNINGPAFYGDTTYVFADTFTWMKGKHTWKFGGSLGIVQNNAQFAYSANGQFNFNGSLSDTSVTGTDLAAFLLGAPTYYQQYPNGFSAIRSHQYAGFAQDEWKVTSRLVLTLGVRYEYNSPKTDPQNRQYYIIPDHQSLLYPNAPTGLLFPGDPGAPYGTTFPDKHDWAPRIGFAWDPKGDGKTSIRGGFGIFYDVLKGLDNQYQNGTPPFFSAAYLGFYHTGLPGELGGSPGQLAYMSQPFPNAYNSCTGGIGVPNSFPSSSLPSPSTLDFCQKGFLPLGFLGVFIDPHMVTPYTYQYNLSVQRQLGSSLVAEVGYLGSSSLKLTATVDHDPFDLKTGVRILNEQPGMNIPNSWVYAIGNGNVVNANYNGLVASLTKRMGDWHSLGNTFFTASYTWSHEIDDSGGMFRNTSQVPAYNHAQFRASGDADLRNRFALSGGWTLPFEHLFPDGPKGLTRGWTLYPIVTVQSGLPMDVLGGLYLDGFSQGPSGVGDQNLVKPNWAGGPPKSLDPHVFQTINGNSGHFIFNPTGLSEPACYFTPTGAPPACPTLTYGTLPRNFFRGPGRVNFDLALEKATSFYNDKMQMTFRAEFFNVLNHTEWQNPSGGPALFQSPLLGQITSTFAPRIGQLSLRFSF